MLHFKQGIGWKACYDDERDLYTAKTSWRGDFHLFEIDEEIYNRVDAPDVDADSLIHTGRQLYYSPDSPIGPPTDMVIDMSSELTDIAVDLWENDETRSQRRKQRKSGKEEKQ